MPDLSTLPKPDTSSAAERLAAKGVPLTLADGRVVMVRYGFASLARLEKQFGGLASIQDAVDLEAKGPLFGPVVTLLNAGLMHYTINGGPVTDEVLYDLIDPEQVRDVVKVISDALVQAFPTAQAEPQAEPTP